MSIDDTGELKPYNSIITTTSISLNKTTTSLQVDQIEILIPTSAPADTICKITAIDSSTVTIIATTVEGKFTDTCTVTVIPNVNTRAILNITMTNGAEKEYDLSSTEVDSFINWYDNKAAGTGIS